MFRLGFLENCMMNNDLGTRELSFPLAIRLGCAGALACGLWLTTGALQAQTLDRKSVV